MNSTCVYSPSQNAFLMLAWRDIYVSAGTWPDDVVEVSDGIFDMFSASPPIGKMRVADSNGMPAWADVPPPTRDELIANIEHERQSLLNYADKITMDWRTELALDEINSEDKANLSAWIAYKRSVKSVSADAAIASDFAWPEPPAE